MARRVTFAELSVGTCFAFDIRALQATRRKVSTRSTIMIPGGKRPFHMDDLEVHVSPKACPTSFGRRKKRSR